MSDEQLAGTHEEKVQVPDGAEAVAMDDSKPQISLPASGRMVVILPLDKISLPLARGLLLEASDAAKLWYIKQAQAKPQIITPSSGIRGKLAKVFGR